MKSIVVMAISSAVTLICFCVSGVMAFSEKPFWGAFLVAGFISLLVLASCGEEQ